MLFGWASDRTVNEFEGLQVFAGNGVLATQFLSRQFPQLDQFSNARGGESEFPGCDCHAHNFHGHQLYGKPIGVNTLDNAGIYNYDSGHLLEVNYQPVFVSIEIVMEV